MKKNKNKNTKNKNKDKKKNTNRGGGGGGGGGTGKVRTQGLVRDDKLSTFFNIIKTHERKKGRKEER